MERINDIRFIVDTLSILKEDQLHDLSQADRKTIQVVAHTLTNPSPSEDLSFLKNREFSPIKQNIFVRILHWIQNIFTSRIGIKGLPIKLVPQSELESIFKLPKDAKHPLSLQKELIARGYAPIIHSEVTLSALAQQGKEQRFISNVNFSNIAFDKNEIKGIAFKNCGFSRTLFNQCQFSKVTFPNSDMSNNLKFINCKEDGKPLRASELIGSAIAADEE